MALEGVRRRKRVPFVVALVVLKENVVKLAVRVALPMDVKFPVALLLQAQECFVNPPVVLAAA